jgi:hypothetical protein
MEKMKLVPTVCDRCGDYNEDGHKVFNKMPLCARCTPLVKSYKKVKRQEMEEAGLAKKRVHVDRRPKAEKARAE